MEHPLVKRAKATLRNRQAPSRERKFIQAKKSYENITKHEHDTFPGTKGVGQVSKQQEKNNNNIHKPSSPRRQW
jgi:hypothetical protein